MEVKKCSFIFDRFIFLIPATHPVDPGHNAPSTSVAPSVPCNASSSATPSSSSYTPIFSSGGGTLFVNTSSNAQSLSSLANGMISGRLPSASDVRTGLSQTALFDPLRQAFMANAAAAGVAPPPSAFANPLFGATPSNLAFPFLALLQQPQQQQQQPQQVKIFFCLPQILFS